MMNFIFLVCIYPVLFLTYFIQRNEGTSQFGTLFGIKYSEEWLSNEERERLETEYCHTMNKTLLLLAFIPSVCFFIPYASIAFSIWMLWMTAVIILFLLPYSKGNHTMKKLKDERCPKGDTETVIYAEIKNAGNIHRVKWQQFLPPCVVSIVLSLCACFYSGREYFALYGVITLCFALCTLLFYGCAVYMDRQKTKVISTDSDINVNYTRAVKNIYKDFWLQSAWLNNLLLMVLCIAMVLEVSKHATSSPILIWGLVIYSFLELWLCMRMSKKLRFIVRKYQKKMDLSPEDDERNWIGGILYFNPRDKHVMVEKRVGVGTTINMATPAGMATGVFSVITLLSIPVVCIWMILLEFVPISLSVQDEVLIARHLKNDYVIEIDSITELTLEDELPRSSRTNGTGMENLQKGNYRNSLDGRIQMFLNPQNQYYLRIISEGTIYYLGGVDDTETREVYALLTDN